MFNKSQKTYLPLWSVLLEEFMEDWDRGASGPWKIDSKLFCY